MDFFYKFRQFLSGPPAVIVAIVIITTPISKVVERMLPKDLFEIPVTLNDPPPPPPPPKLETQEIKPQPVEQQPMQPADVITKDSVVTEVKPAPPPEPPRQTDVPRAIEVPPVRTGPSVGQIQAGYESIILGYIESIKRYPTSREARSQRPQGKVALLLEIGRDGSLKSVSVSRSSDSIILDNAALATARQGRYPPFPADAYPGQATHRFSVTLEFNVQQEN